MKRLNLSLAIYLLLVFASGVLVGILGQKFYQARSVSAQTGRPANRAEEYRRKLISEMRSRMDLRPEQEQQVNAVLDATRERFRSVQQKFEPEMKAIYEDQHEQIRAILDAGQKPEYDKMLAERKLHRKRQPR